MYHSVQRVRTDPWGLRVSPRNFAAQMAIIRRRMRPMRLDELDRLIKAGERPPARSVVVTFDDGYADNLHNAKPVLERFEVPATVFVATGTIGANQEYWWDELERIVLVPRRLPRLLRVDIDGERYERDLGDAAEFSRWTQWRSRNWRAWYPVQPGRRHEIFIELWKRIKAATSCGRRETMEQLRQWAPVAPPSRESHRAVTRAELHQLARGGLIEIGAHTVSHPSLGSISDEEQQIEIHQSKAWLERELKISVSSFSYPFGTAKDYTPWTIAALQNAGIVRACTTIAGFVRDQTNPFEYPRRGIMNWGGREFAQRLSRWREDALQEIMARA